MSTRWTVLLLLVTAWLAAGAARAAEEVRVGDSGRVDVGERFGFLHDSAGKLSVDDVMNRVESLPWQTGITNLSFVDGPVWVHVRLVNDTGREQTRTLALTDDVPDEALFVVASTGPGGRAVERRVDDGFLSPSRGEGAVGLRCGVSLVLPPHGARDVFARFTHTEQLDLTMVAVDERGYARVDLFWTALLSGYLGLALCLIIYALALFHSIRDWSYVYYAGTAFLFTLLATNDAGLFAMLPLPGRMAMAAVMRPSITLLALAMLLLFAREFLSLPSVASWLARAFRWIAAALAVAAVVGWRRPVPTGHLTLAAVAFTALCLALAAFLSLRQGNRYVRYFLAAYACPLVMSIVWIAGNLAGEARALGPTIIVAFAAELLIMATGLAARVAAMRRGLLEQLSTRERRLSEALAEADRQSRVKDDFLGTLSHELRTPIAAILGWLELARTPEVSDDDRGKAFGVIERNARHQLQLVEDLLDVSRLVAGRMSLERQPTELGALAREAAEAVATTARARGVTVAVEGGDVTIDGDAERLRQVLWNLLSNAVKFSTEGGEVLVTVGRERGQAVVRVRDQGVGLAPEFVPHVFDRFSQADTSLSRRYGGLGLGLAICKRLVELHGGEIEAASPGPGRGATFTVRLPGAPPTP